MNKFTRYSLAAILFAVLVVSGFFAGYNRGFQSGRSLWVESPTFTKTYSVKDWFLFSHKMQRFENEKSETKNPFIGAITESDFAPIIDDIQRDVLPHIWKNDSNSKIDAFVADFSIVVHANATVHHELERYLEVCCLNAKNNVANYQK